MSPNTGTISAAIELACVQKTADVLLYTHLFKLAVR